MSHALRSFALLLVVTATAQAFPEVVTEQTRSDTELLARLQTPGTVFFADSADSGAGFDAYLEVRGRGDGRARVVSDTGSVHRGAGAYEFVAPENGGHESGSGAPIASRPACNRGKAGGGIRRPGISLSNYWGNFFQPTPEQRLVPERGRWYCLEQMIRVNDPGQANGEMAAWIDGELYIHATGFRWRTTAEVRLKRASFGIYVHAATRENRVWYDDIVLSTGYVGPVAPEDSGPGSAISETTWGKLKTP